MPASPRAVIIRSTTSPKFTDTFHAPSFPCTTASPTSYPAALPSLSTHASSSRGHVPQVHAAPRGKGSMPPPASVPGEKRSAVAVGKMREQEMEMEGDVEVDVDRIGVGAEGDALDVQDDGDVTLDVAEDVSSARADKRMKRLHSHSHPHNNHSPNSTPTASSFKHAHAHSHDAAPHTASPVGRAQDAQRKRKNQRLASQEKKEARREKMHVNGLGGGEGAEMGHDVRMPVGEGAADAETEGEESHVPPHAHALYQTAPPRRDASKHMGEGKRRGGNKGRGRGAGGGGLGGSGSRKGGRSPVGGLGEISAVDASDGDISSNDTDDDMEADDDEPPSHTAAALDDELPLPDGVDPANVEDPLLDAVPAALAARDAAAWIEETSDEEFMFASLSDYSVTEVINDEDPESGSSSDASDSASAMDEDDDPLLNDVFGSAIGLHDNGEFPLVLMEDWSGNLVFAQPRVAEDQPARRSSKSRSRSSRSARGSRTGSTSNGDGPVLLIDSEAVDAGWDDEYDEEVDGGDTTDSLPSDEDMPSPPDIGPFSLAAKGLEANNAAFGVTTIDEAALAQDLGVPLEDARNLLERVRAEDALQNAVAASDAASMSGSAVTPGDVTFADGILQTADTPGSSGASHSPLVPHATPVAYQPQPATSGVPMMGSFLPECADPGKRAVIDGTGKTTPSPFARKGALRSRSRGAKAGSSTVKKQAVGPMSPLHRGRFSSVPPRGRFRNGTSHSPLRNFDREDTPSDADMAAEPISLDDVLDTDALHRHTYETEGHDHDGSHHLRNLRRWEKVPITTFRRSRINSMADDASGSDMRASQGYPASGTALRNAMGSPGATDSHRSTLIFSQGMIISPILQPIEEGSYGGGSPNHLSRKNRRKEERRARNGGTKRMRTASLGTMPPLDLGSGLA